MLTPYSRQNTDLLPLPFAPNTKVLGKMLAALDNKENTNSNESHILNDFSCHRIYILYVTVSEKCEAHADEESKDNEKRQVTAL